jgi:hypothetical protein
MLKTKGSSMMKYSLNLFLLVFLFFSACTPTAYVGTAEINNIQRSIEIEIDASKLVDNDITIKFDGEIVDVSRLSEWSVITDTYSTYVAKHTITVEGKLIEVKHVSTRAGLSMVFYFYESGRQIGIVIL